MKKSIFHIVLCLIVLPTIIAQKIHCAQPSDPLSAIKTYFENERSCTCFSGIMDQQCKEKYLEAEKLLAYEECATLLRKDIFEQFATLHVACKIFTDDESKKHCVNPFGNILLRTKTGRVIANIENKVISAGLFTLGGLQKLASDNAQKWRKEGLGLAFLEKEINAQEKDVFLLNANIEDSIRCAHLAFKKTMNILTFYGSLFEASYGKTSYTFNVIATHDHSGDTYTIIFANSSCAEGEKLRACTCKTLQGLQNGYIYFLAGLWQGYQQFQIYPYSYEVTTNKEALDAFMKQIKTDAIDMQKVKQCRGVYTLGMYNPFY